MGLIVIYKILFGTYKQIMQIYFAVEMALFSNVLLSKTAAYVPTSTDTFRGQIFYYAKGQSKRGLKY